jgi:cytochrome d ubiquinol oxidase subunit I
MLDSFDPILLARIQFAFTVGFHIIFPAFTIGLASWLVVVEWRWLKTGNAVYAEIYRFWIKIFAVAFFLEASFLGVMLFGWNRVSRKMHFASTIIVAIGTLISAFWILSANSWMQTPQGYRIGEGGLLYPTSWVEIIFNPSFPYRFAHMIIAAYLTTAFAVGGAGAYYLWRNQHVKHARIMLGMAMLMAVFVAPFQALMGDLHGLNTLKHQPVKVAAMEGLWETQRGAPLNLFAWPDEEAETNRFALEIPKLSSLILTHDLNGEVKGLKAWPREERPPVAWVFWSFRVMVGIGLLMILTGIMAAILFFRKRLFNTPWFQYWCMAMTPSGFIAVLAGWFVTEIGRQPYIAYGILRTSESVSPVIGPTVALSLLAFIISYAFIFGAGAYYILRLISKGPGTHDKSYGAHGVDNPPLVTGFASELGGKNAQL